MKARSSGWTQTSSHSVSIFYHSNHDASALLAQFPCWRLVSFLHEMQRMVLGLGGKIEETEYSQSFQPKAIFGRHSVTWKGLNLPNRWQFFKGFNTSLLHWFALIYNLPAVQCGVWSFPKLRKSATLTITLSLSPFVWRKYSKVVIWSFLYGWKCHRHLKKTNLKMNKSDLRCLNAKPGKDESLIWTLTMNVKREQ